MIEEHLKAVCEGREGALEVGEAHRLPHELLVDHMREPAVESRGWSVTVMEGHGGTRCGEMANLASRITPL